MPVYQELPPEVVQEMLKGYKDELEGAKRVDDAFYRQFPCPRCGGECQRAFLGIKHALPEDGENLLPRSGLRCKLCDCLFDPHSGLILELGNVGKIQERLQPTQVPWVGQEEEDE